jgi:outer membrane immunogenic protein
MRKTIGRIIRVSALTVWCLAASEAVAEGLDVWDGLYLGPQLGSSTNTGCSQWTSVGTGLDVSGQMASRVCGTGSFVGGLQVGENFQYKHVFWGLAADLDFTTAKTSGRPWFSGGTPAPAGTYFTSERLGPNGFLVLAPRVGYAGGEWAPYLRAGALIAPGGRDSTLTYTPPGTTQPTAAFKGGKGFNAIGPVAGGGIEWGLNGPWSIGLEYMHASLGKGTNSTATCTGTSAACAGLAGISFQNSHNAFTLNTFRLTANYYFSYW